MSLPAQLYFGIQRLRAGVRPKDVSRAVDFLGASAEQIDQHLAERLAAIHGASPPWREWICTQHPTTKDEFRERSRNLVGRGVEWRRTSGSTGQPMRFPRDRAMTAQMDAAMWAAYSQHNISPGDRQARFWGTPKGLWARTRRRGLDVLLRQRRLSAFEMTPHRSEAFHRRLVKFRAKYAYGYPTVMDRFAEHCDAMGRSGLQLGLSVVISTGELLSPSIRQRLTQFFGCPVVNEYGCSESGVLAIECGHGRMHPLNWAALMEIVDDDNEPLKGAGQGSVLVTDLFGTANPLLRYQLGDRVSTTREGCPCGRSDVLAVDVARQDNFIELPSGRIVYDAILAYTVPLEVRRFLVEQQTPDKLVAYLVPGDGFDSHVARSVLSAWNDALGGEVDIRMEVVKEIPASASAKLGYFTPLASPPGSDT